MSQPEKSPLLSDHSSRDPQERLLRLARGLRERGIMPQGTHDEGLRALEIVDALESLVSAVAPLLDEGALGSYVWGEWEPADAYEVEATVEQGRRALDAFYDAERALSRREPVSAASEQTRNDKDVEAE